MLPISNDTEQFLRSGLNLIGQALSIYGQDLRLIHSNRRFQQLFDLPTALVTPGARFVDTLRYLAQKGEYGDIGDIDTFLKAREDQALAFEPHYMERQRANGSWISVEGSPLRQGGWVAVYTDITQIKWQEELLRARSDQLSDQLLSRSEELAQTNRALEATISALNETQTELEAAEARIRLATETTPAHIARLDRNHVYTYSNRRLAEVITQGQKDIIGHHARDMLGTEVYDRIAPVIDDVLQGAPQVLEFDVAQDNRRIRSAFTPDTDDEGTVQGVYVLSMDVTAEAQARAALQQTRKRELVTQLASGLTHDFSNLLTIILGLQSELERVPNLPRAARRIAETTRAAALRGGTLLDRLGDMSGTRKLSPVPLEIDTLFSEVSALASGTLHKSIDLQFINQFGASAVLVDRGSMQDALINLILNARDAIGRAGTILVTAQRRGVTWLEFSVEDTGPGFSTDALDRALDPFFTTKAANGSGLGLTMVYDFAQLSGGRLLMANAPQRGAKVTLQLPLKEAIEPSKNAFVLLVEDQPDIRQAVRQMILDGGAQVIEADSIEEATNLVSMPGLTHVLSDIMLGTGATGLDLGLELARTRPDLHVTLMSGLPVTDPLRIQAADQFEILSKPFDAVVLRAVLSTEAPSWP